MLDAGIHSSSVIYLLAERTEGWKPGQVLRSREQLTKITGPMYLTLNPALGHLIFRFWTRTRPAFVQYRTDFRQTKIAVRSLARASGESNAREWWVPVRVSVG